MESKLRLSLPMKVPDLRRFILELEREMGEIAAAHRRAGVTSAQGLILRILTEGGGQMSVADLNGQLRLDKSTVSQSLAQLQKLGWLRMEENPQDRRFKLIRLSPDGEQRMRMLCFEIDDVLFQSLELASLDQKNAMLAGVAYLQHFLKKRRISSARVNLDKENTYEVDF